MKANLLLKLFLKRSVFLTQIRILNDIKCHICVFHTPRFSPDAKFL